MPSPRLHVFAHRLLSASVDHLLSWDNKHEEFTISAEDAAQSKSDDPFEQELISHILRSESYSTFISLAANLFDLDPLHFITPERFPLSALELPPLQP